MNYKPTLLINPNPEESFLTKVLPAPMCGMVPILGMSLFCLAAARAIAACASALRSHLRTLGTLTAVLALLFIVPSIATASIIASNGFEGLTLGALSGQGGGTGWTGNWTAPGATANVVDTTSSPLTYTISGGATLTGGSRAVNYINGQANTGQIFGSRQLATPIAGSTFYVSFLLQHSAGTFASFDKIALYVSDTADSTTVNNFNVGPRYNSTVMTFQANQGTGNGMGGQVENVASTVFATGTTALCVAQVVWNGSAYNTINAWVNPARGDSGTPQVAFTGGSQNPTSIKYIFFRGNEQTSTQWQVDNIVIGSSWDDVVPPAASCTPPTVQTVSGNATITYGNSTNVTMAGSQSGVTYQLYAGASPSGATTSGTGSAIVWTVSPTNTTTYTVQTTTAGGYCATPMSGSALITVNPPASLTNSLTGYTGTSQDNWPAQPALLNGSWLNVSYVWNNGFAAWEIINFDSTGAKFGSSNGGNGQSDDRNYLRTTYNNYALGTLNYTAYVTVNRTSASQAVYFGMGAGDVNFNNSKLPDNGTTNTSVYLELQDGYPNASRRVCTNSTSYEDGYTVMTSTTGLMRLRMAYDANAQTITYAINYNPTGQNPGDFVANQSWTVNLSSIASLWTGKRASIYFGGEKSVVFSNFMVNATLPSGGIDHFTVTASSPQTAGTPFNVTITAQDVSNATVNDSTTTVTVSSPTGGSLMEFDWNGDGTYGDNSGTLVSGVKTIKARNKKAQTVTIAAAGGGATTPAPASVTTTAGAFSQLQILAPGETAAPGTATGKTGTARNRIINRAFNITVNAVDAYWNPVSSTDTIAVKSTDLVATLPANAALIAGTTNLLVTLNTLGSFNVTATNVSNSSITSGTTAVTVSPFIQSAGTWKSFPIQYLQTPDTNWSSVPVASVTNVQGHAVWDIKDIKVCNDATNLYLLVELWPDSTVNLQAGIENYFWIDGDNNFTTGYVNPDDTGVGAEDVLDAWEVWTSGVKQTLWWGVTANTSPNANVYGPGGNPNGGWGADQGLYYEYSMSLAATNTDGSKVFPSNSVTIGLGSRYNGALQATVPAFNYTFATYGLKLTNNVGVTNSYGQTLVFTAVVQTNNVTAPNASSNVVFSLGSTPVWTNAMVNGAAYYTNTSLPAGVTNLTAQYLGDANYQPANVTVTQTVLQTTPTLTLTASAITYGQTLASSSLSGSGATNTYNLANVPGAFAFANPGLQPNVVGTTNVWVIFTPGDTTNYTTASNTVSVTVSKAASTVTVTGTTSFIYNGTGQGPATANVTGSSGSPSFLYSGTGYGPTASVPTNAGSYSVTATVAADNNYNGASSSATAFTIGAAPASVTANPQTKTYGNVNPVLTAATNGAVNGDVINVTITTTATQFSAVGVSNITVTAGSNPNYTVLTTNSTLTINPASSFVGASSTKNPSGYKDTVTYIATLPSDATGNVVFSSTNGAFSTNSASSGSATSLSITNLPRGTNVITVAYLGDGNYVGSTNTLDQIVTNHPPVAADATYYRAKGLSLKIAITNLLTKVTDADADTNTLQSVGEGLTNATIMTDSTCVYYLPGTGAGSNDNDVVSYTVSDGFGGTATANILVNVYSAAGPAQMSIPTNGAVNITFFGIPNYTYIVQTTTNLSAPWWTLSTNTASTNGSWQFTDPNATNEQQYYRSAQP